MTDSDDLLRVALVALALLVVVPVVLMTVMAPMMGLWWTGGEMGPGMMYGAGRTGGLWWVATLLLPLLVLAVLGYLAYRLLSSDGDTDAALEELRLAYARGDLSDEEYETRRERLRD
jgi:putative membrane protein